MMMMMAMTVCTKKIVLAERTIMVVVLSSYLEGEDQGHECPRETELRLLDGWNAETRDERGYHDQYAERVHSLKDPFIFVFFCKKKRATTHDE